VLEIVPGLADHVTCIWGVLITVAENLSFAPDGTVTAAGATVTVTVNAAADDAIHTADIMTALENTALENTALENKDRQRKPRRILLRR
jgi:hypothetical protein